MNPRHHFLAKVRNLQKIKANKEKSYRSLLDSFHAVWREIWSRSPASEAISSGIQSQGSTEENAIACERLSIGENFVLEDNWTHSLLVLKNTKASVLKFLTLTKKKSEEAVTKGPQEKMKTFLENRGNENGRDLWKNLLSNNC